MTESAAASWTMTPGMTLGREGTNAVQVDDPVAEARHAQFFIRDGQWRIVDLDSVDGTFLNNCRIREGVLHDGDRIRVGGAEFEFRASPSESREVPPCRAGTGGVDRCPLD